MKTFNYISKLIYPLLFLITSLLVTSCGGGGGTDSFDLFAFKNSNGDWGYLNSEGEIVINNQFEEANPFYDGRARVVIENSDGKDVFVFIDSNGEYDYSKTWDVAMDFSDGLAIVRNNLGYPKAINTDLEVVLEFKEAYSISRFSEGRAFMFKDTGDGQTAILLDKSGNEINRFDAVEGVKVLTHFDNGVAYIFSDSGYSLIDIDGNELHNFGFEKLYKNIGDFTSGTGTAMFGNKGDWGLLNSDGSIEVNPQFEKIFKDGKNYLVRSGKKWGWVDDDGKYFINPQFNDAGNRGFNGTGLAPVKVGKKWGYIDREGKLEINPQFDAASSFYGNIALVYDRSIRGHGIIGSDGKYVANPQFKDFLDEYYETRPSWDLGLGSGLFSIETDYLDVDAIVKTIKENITPSGIYNVNPNKLIISDLINAKNNDSTFFNKSCGTEGYNVKSVSNYQDYYYDYDNYKSYSEGYYKLSSTSRIGTSSPDKAYALTNLYKVDFSESNPGAIMCPNFVYLDNISFYANVRGNKKIKRGFREYNTKVYSSSKDNGLGLSNLKISFKTFYGNILSTYKQSKRKLVANQLRDLIDPNKEIYKSINIDSGGRIVLTMNDPYAYFSE